MANRIYEIPIPATWKDGRPFDPANDTTARLKLDENIKRWRQARPDERAGYELDSIDQDRHVVTLIRRRHVAGVERDHKRLIINLPDNMCQPGKGRLVCSTFEPTRAGWYVTEFKPYQGKAVMEQLSDSQLACRAILANALRIQPWDLTVTPTEEGGWLVRLGDGIIYSTNQDPAMQTAVETKGVGRPGWWFDSDSSTGRITIHPGQLPTFDKAYPYPWDLLADPGRHATASFGVRLPDHGGEPAPRLDLDWRESSFLLVGGEGGTGKSVAINDLLAAEISQRVNLAIIDTPNKASDYYWCRPWVTPGYWGCESEVQAAGVVNRLVNDIEHGERAKAWAEHGWQSWYDIPDWAKARYPIFDIVIDEYSTLVDGAQLVKTLPNPDKTLPAVCEQTFLGHARYRIKSNVIRLLRTARAQGYRLILISQTVNDRSGLGPTTRDLFGHRMVMGPNPSESLVNGVFHDPRTVPPVGKNILDDGVSKGVGRSELAGDRARVFKTYWAGGRGLTDTQWFGRRLADLIGLPDDVDRDRYLDTLREHTGDDPVDVEYMRHLTDRISIPYRQALATDAIMGALKDVWDESRMTFGDGAASTPPDTAGGDPGPADTPATPVGAADGGGVQLMDAASLARLMEGR